MDQSLKNVISKNLRHLPLIDVKSLLPWTDTQLYRVDQNLKMVFLKILRHLPSIDAKIRAIVYVL